MNAKAKCRCGGFVCHTGPGSPLHLAFFPSKVGGKGLHALVSDECHGRLKGSRVIVTHRNHATA
jgi:hypothetical protein